jgi:hypothetical protein
MSNTIKAIRRGDLMRPVAEQARQADAEHGAVEPAGARRRLAVFTSHVCGVSLQTVQALG